MSDTAQLISEIQADGIHLAATERGTIKAKGDKEKLARWVPILRERKPDILRELSVTMSIFDVMVDGTVITVIAPGNVSVASLEKNALARFGAGRLQGVRLRNRVHRSAGL